MQPLSDFKLYHYRPASSCSAAGKLLGLGYPMPQIYPMIARTADAPATTRKRTGWIIAILIFGFLWFELINFLKAEWWLNPQYNYGLIVPLLSLYLFWRRWLSRPTPMAATAAWLAIILLIVGAVLFLPIRFLVD